MNPNRPEPLRRWRKSAIVLMTLALVVGACSGADTSETTTTAGGGDTSTTAAGATTTTGGDTTTTAASADTPTGTLVLAISNEPESLDPQMHRDRNSQMVSRMIADNLYSVDLSTNTWTPELAVSWEESGPTSWDFHLREGVFFHNGEPFNAESVVATWERLSDPALNSPRLNMSQPFESIEVIDDYTVRFHMAQPYAHSPAAQPGGGFGYSQEMMPPSMTSMSPEEYIAAGPVGTGPFKFVEYVPGQRIVLEANVDYWKGTPGVAEVVVRLISEEATAVAELLAGSVHIVWGIETDTAENLRATPGVSVLEVPGTAQFFLGMNMNLPTALRQAINHAIDRPVIIDALFGGAADESFGPSFLGQQGYIDEDLYPFDPERARELLAEAGDPGPLELLTLENRATEAEAIAEQLRTNLGLEISVVTTDAAAYNAAREAGDFQIAYQSFGAATGTFLGAFYNRHFSCATRDEGIAETGFCDPAIDELEVEARSQTDPAAAEEIMKEMNRAIMVDPPWVPLWNPSTLYGVRDEVKNFNPSPTVTHTWLWQVSLED